MPTKKQIAANRRNAQKSTGPRTEAGKAKSKMNALKSGIHAQSVCIPGEEMDALERITAEYYRRFEPSAPEQRYCVDSLIHCDWQRRRLWIAQKQLWEFLGNYNMKNNEHTPLGETLSDASATLDRVQSRLLSLDRAYFKALSELKKLQGENFGTKPFQADPLKDQVVEIWENNLFESDEDEDDRESRDSDPPDDDSEDDSEDPAA